MNPFDLPGPEFLLFYLAVGALVLVGVRLSQQLAEAGDVPRIDTSDPYLVAFLRGGAAEAVRIAAMSLVTRGLLEVRSDTRLQAVRGARTELSLQPLERALLTRCSTGPEVKELVDDDALQAECADYETRLQQLGLLPDEAARDGRFRVMWWALILVVGIAAGKLFVAYASGRSNVGFLVALAIGFSVLIVVLSNVRLTARGRRLVADLRSLFENLKGRSSQMRQGGDVAELALLGAVFGLSAVPVDLFPDCDWLFPKAANTSGCGSSCGLSCSSSCGGGCGGGCGGCGS